MRASLTRLGTKLGELERSTDQPDRLDHTKHLTARLEDLCAEYKTHHYSIVDLTDDEKALQVEQDTLDAHDKNVVQLGIRIQWLITACSKSPDSVYHKIASKQLTCLMARLLSVEESIASMLPCLLKQHEEQLSEFKS